MDETKVRFDGDSVQRRLVVEELGECWEWQGTRTNSGHGVIWSSQRKKMLPVYRLAYERNHGSIPSGLVVRHRCDNPSCVNPDHLVSGTHRDNAMDRLERVRPDDGGCKLNYELVRAIRHEVNINGCSRDDASRRFDVCKSTVDKIVVGDIWREAGGEIASKAERSAPKPYRRLAADEQREALAMVDAGARRVDIAARFGCSRATIGALIKMERTTDRRVA